MRDQRDPIKLYERIKTVQRNHGCSLAKAADIVEQMRKEAMDHPLVTAILNGKVVNSEDLHSEQVYSSNGR